MNIDELLNELNPVLAKHGIKVIRITPPAEMEQAAIKSDEPILIENRPNPSPNPSPNAGSDSITTDDTATDNQALSRKRKLGNLLNLIRN